MSDSDSDGDYYGPPLPPNLQNPSKPSSSTTSTIVQEEAPKLKLIGSISLPAIGPTLPPGFKLPSTDESTYLRQHQEAIDEESESDEDVIGPLPPDHPLALARASSYRSPESEEKPKKKLQREEWMLIPPSNKPVTELGLGPRKFLTRAPDAPVDDDGKPFDVDSDEEFERETRAALDQKIIDEYDTKMEAMIDKSDKGKRKSESLLDIHQRELKKKSKHETKEEAKRKPFDRDTDLAVSGLTREDSKKYIEKTRELGGRFHKGRQKFL